MSAPAPTSMAPAAGPGSGELLNGVVRPTKRDEAWRYAPHRRLDELTFGPTAAGAVDVPAELVERIPQLDGPRIVVVNGVVDHGRSDLGPMAGVHLHTLADATSTHPELVARHSDPGASADAFTAYNVAYGTDGAVIVVDAGAEIDLPIHVVDIVHPSSAPNASSTGVVIHLGAGSCATVVETRLGAGSEFGGSNVRTTITLDHDATLEHIVVQDLASNLVHLSRVEAVLGERSALRTRSFNLGAAYGRLAYHVELAGADASVDLSGLFFGVGDQVLDQQITVVHRAKDCTSRQLFRGVLDDASTGVFNGGIDVCPGADGTDAEQSNDNLLLSDRAEVNTQPRLEILADEVACKHGATVGQLDDTAMYYLRSRGIAADEARRLLINGFADEVVDDVGLDALRSWITRRLGHDHD
jgi:Fe-S cluster assembly protein SufD